MDLKDFIKGALTDIVNGVSEAQKEGARVNPAGSTGLAETKDQKKVHVIEFDIAVTATTGQGTKSGIAVVAGFFGGGLGAESNSNAETTSRLKFSIPVVLPESE